MRELLPTDPLVRPFVTGKTFLMELFEVLRQSSALLLNEEDARRRRLAFDVFFDDTMKAGRRDEIKLLKRYARALTSKWRPMTSVELSSAEHKNTCYLERLPILQEVFAHWQDEEISRVQALEAFAFMKDSYSPEYMKLVEDFLKCGVSLTSEEIDIVESVGI